MEPRRLLLKEKGRPPKGPRFVAVRDEGKVLSSRTDIGMRAEVCGLRLAGFWCTDFAWNARGAGAGELTDFVRWEARGARG